MANEPHQHNAEDAQIAGAQSQVDRAAALASRSGRARDARLIAKAKGPLAVMPKPYVELAREDAAALGIKEGEMVKVNGNGAELQLEAKIDIRLPKGLLFVPYHFTDAGLNRMYKGEATIAVTVSK